MRISLKEGVVTFLEEEHPDLVRGRVRIADREEPVIAFVRLTGPLCVGDRVQVNTTAVDLGLGTGGFHIVVANLSRPQWESEGAGHTMKARYTPWQHAVLAAEEDGSPFRDRLDAIEDLAARPVLVAPLHSHLAPLAASLKFLGQRAADEAQQSMGIEIPKSQSRIPNPEFRIPVLRIAYIHMDWAALPLALSDAVRACRQSGLVDLTVTVGQSFGGDVEAISLASGMAVAAAEDCHVIIIAPGPGHLGSGTRWGFSGTGQADALHVAETLGGRPILVPRISFADPRARHQGVSHHTLTILTRLVRVAVDVPIPLLPAEAAARVREQLRQARVFDRHRVVERAGEVALQAVAAYGLEAQSMGRTVEDDPAFFLAAGAAAQWAIEMTNDR